MTREPEAPDPAAPFVPDYTLYAPKSVALATFLGGPFAGSIVYAINERRLRSSGAAVTALVGGFVGTLVLVAALFLLPDLPTARIAKKPLSLAAAVIFYFI